MTTTCVSKENCVHQKRPAKETCKTEACNGVTLIDDDKCVKRELYTPMCQKRPVYTKRDLQTRPAKKTYEEEARDTVTLERGQQICQKKPVYTKRDLQKRTVCSKRDLQTKLAKETYKEEARDTVLH